MTRFEQLQNAIREIPEEFQTVKNHLKVLLNTGDLLPMKNYVNGAYAMALCLTGDEKLITPLFKIVRLLK